VTRAWLDTWQTPLIASASLPVLSGVFSTLIVDKNLVALGQGFCPKYLWLMATLLAKTNAGPVRVIQLRLGVNRFGRSPANDFVIEHPTVSARHCEIDLENSGVVVRDCNSTNGTFINGEPIKQAKLIAGARLQLGDVELVV